MKANAKTPRAINYRSVARKVDRQILELFPSLNIANPSNNSITKTAIAGRLMCLKALGNETRNLSNLSKELGFTSSDTARVIKELVSLSLVKAEKKGRTIDYSITTVGLIALMAFEEFRDWPKIKGALAVPQKRNDPIAFAVLVVGYCGNKPDSAYQALCKYASQGHILENVAVGCAAESLLSFYRQELRTASPVPPAYLSVFKEFTTAGFQEVFRMLLMAIKPTAEDYNWLVEFFNEASEFYFDPARVAYINLLSQNGKLRGRLEEFKKAQDQQIKKQDGSLEVTFSIPGTGMSKVDAMPAHLKAIGMRLILEPIKFINNELVNFFWNTQT